MVCFDWYKCAHSVKVVEFLYKFRKKLYCRIIFITLHDASILLSSPILVDAPISDGAVPLSSTTNT